jgi:hypothetical protein
MRRLHAALLPAVLALACSDPPLNSAPATGPGNDAAVSFADLGPLGKDSGDTAAGDAQPDGLASDLATEVAPDAASDADSATDAAADTASSTDADAVTADMLPIGCQHGSQCDDGNACTADTCGNDGICQHAQKPCDDNLNCTQDGCDAKTGACSTQVTAGFCVIDGACWGNGQGGSNPCVLCDPKKQQTAWSAQVGKPCDDGVACTEKDACTVGGTCAGAPKAKCCQGDLDCQSGEPCTFGACDLASGTCSVTKKPNCCAAGPCCDVATAAVKQKGTICGVTPVGSQYQCAGNQVQKRDQLPACDGKDAATCPSDPAIATWGVWQTVANCGGDSACVLQDAKQPPTCEPKAPTGCKTDADCNDQDACTADTCVSGNCKHATKDCAAATACETAACDPKGGQCVQTVKPGTCKIGGACYLEGAVEANDNCKTCAPSVSPSTWTPVPGCSKPVQCSPGSTCCTGDGTWLKKGAKCGQQAWSVEYKCDDTTKPGVDETGTMFVTVQNKIQSCQQVALNVAFGNDTWPACTPGLTCCTPAGTYAKKGTICGTTAWNSEYKCATGPGNLPQVQVRHQVSGCTGSGSGCSSWGDNAVWTPWLAALPCLSDEACKVANADTAGKCLLKGSGSCSQSCGGASKDGACMCDALCASLGDCCADHTAKCGGTCAGSCGGKSKDGACWCDAACKSSGDCCLDKSKICGG